MSLDTPSSPPPPPPYPRSAASSNLRRSRGERNACQRTHRRAMAVKFLLRGCQMGTGFTRHGTQSTDLKGGGEEGGGTFA